MTTMIVSPVTLEGPRLRLEPLSQAHQAAFCAVALDEELWRWIPTPVRTPEEMAGYIGFALAEQARGAALPFAVVDKSSDRVIGSTRLDHALTGLSRGADGHAWAYLAAPGGPRVGLWAGDGYRWLQVFTGDPLGPGMRRKAVAIEPMTCPPNAFVTADDLLVLEPGEKVTHAWGVQAC